MKSTEIFIKEMISIFGDKYDYSKIKYINNKTKVCIICPIHGEFYATPHNLLKKKGCPKCVGKNKTTEDFIKECKKIHGDKYDYSKVIYKKACEKIIIICPIHGEFLITPNKHLSKCGCPKCVGKNKTTEDFIIELQTIFGNKYDYSKVEYVNAKTKVCIICPIHGEFYAIPSNLLKKSGCPKCTNKKIFDSDDFISYSTKIHGDKYDYSKVEYVNAKTKVCIICPEHGEFWQRPNDHINKRYGCPLCNESKLEHEIEQMLLKQKINFERQKRFDWLGKQSLDFYLPQYNIAIECQGSQHFKPIDFFNGVEGYITLLKNDKKKYMLTKKHNVKLLYYNNSKKNPIDYFDKIYTNLDDLLHEIIS
jgi:hypothetical protein